MAARTQAKKPSNGGKSNASTSDAGKSSAGKSNATSAADKQTFGEVIAHTTRSRSRELMALVLIALAIISGLALFGDRAGAVGDVLQSVLAVSVGIFRFVAPGVLLWAALELILGRYSERGVRTIFGLVLLTIASTGAAHLASDASGFGPDLDSLRDGGGLLGSASATPLEALVDRPATWAILALLVLFSVLVILNVSLRQTLHGCGWVLAKIWGWLRIAYLAAATNLQRVGKSPENSELENSEENENAENNSAGARLGAADDPNFGEFVSPADQASSDQASESPDEAGPSDAELAAAGLAMGGLTAAGLAALEAAKAKSAKAKPAKARHAKNSSDNSTGEPAATKWQLPSLSLLEQTSPAAADSARQKSESKAQLQAGAELLESALASHGVEARVVGAEEGPTVTRYELTIGSGVKVSRVTSLHKDIAYAMAATDVRILAPIPGRSAIGVEVPNARRQLVALGDILASDNAKKAKHPLQVALGRDISGSEVMANLATMPHLLIAGATGSGKSSCINSLITSLLMRTTPDDVRMILVDPKRVELGQYDRLPHLLTGVVTNPKKAANALAWVVSEMERRYDVLSHAGYRDITGYNEAFDTGKLSAGQSSGDQSSAGQPNADQPNADQPNADQSSAGQPNADQPGADQPNAGQPNAGQSSGSAETAPTSTEQIMAEVRSELADQPEPERMPFIVVVVDELNDLMMVAARDVEDTITRIAQMARAVGIHLVIATQRPSVNVITGVIKANVPSRMAFAVSSLADSRVILDQAGAERLVGRGDMLLVEANNNVLQRVQGCWVSESEVHKVVDHWLQQAPESRYMHGVEQHDSSAASAASMRQASGGDSSDDELLIQAMAIVVDSQLGSTSMLQRKLKVGFARAGRLMDLLEQRGVVGPSHGSKARDVLMTPEELGEPGGS